MLAIMVLSVVQQGFDSGLNERPGTSVERLLLTPNDGLSVGVFVKVLLQHLPWEGVELFDTGDGCTLDIVVGAVLVERSIDLTGTENNTINGIWFIDGGAVLWVLDNPLELGITSEILNWRAGDRMTEERLGEEDDES